MNNQYMPKYIKVKQINRPDGTICYLEKDHINALEDTLLYEDTKIGDKTETTGTDLITILKDIADGSASTECKISTISKNGTAIPIENKNVNIIVPTNLSDLTQDSTHRTVTDAEKTSYVNKIEKITFNSSEITPSEGDKNVSITETDPVFTNWKDSEEVTLGKSTQSETKGISIGNTSTAKVSGVSVGNNAVSNGNSISIGTDTTSQGGGIAIGQNANATADKAVQICEGENKNANTLKYRDTVIVNDSGKIPSVSLEDGVVNKIESITLNGTDLTINTTTKNASGLVKSTLPIPNEISYSYLTTLEFCKKICALDTCKVGVIYCGYSQLTDSPCTGCEVTVSVMKESGDSRVLVLKRCSTNSREKSWMTMYDGNSTTGNIHYGTTDCPWEAELLTPVSSSDDSNDWIGASRKYVLDQLATKVDTSRKIAGLDLQDDITTTELKNALGVKTSPTEATEEEITAGTETTKYISPNRNKNAVKTGVIKNADDMSLDSANQKKVQSWLGTNQLTFTFSDSTTRTFNFVCNEVL